MHERSSGIPVFHGSFIARGDTVPPGCRAVLQPGSTNGGFISQAFVCTCESVKRQNGTTLALPSHKWRCQLKCRATRVDRGPEDVAGCCKAASPAGPF